MSMTTTSDVQFDHKQWFHDIDRWSFYLESWQTGIEDVVRECRRLQQMVDQYADDLEDFADETAAHRNRLLADERAMIEHHPSAVLAPQILKSHESNAAKHDELQRLHERLKRMQQTLTTGMAALRQNAAHAE